MNLCTGPALAALLTLPGVGEKRAETLATHFGDWDCLLAATPQTLIDLLGARTGAGVAEHLPTSPLVADLPPGIQVVSIHEAHYPARLRTLPDPPLLLWWAGTLPPESPTLAVVGTRTPNRFGVAVTQMLSDVAARRGVPVISGLALGIDSLSHVTCLDAGQPTWAVLGQGIGTFPTGGDRARLAARILAAGGGLIAEVPPATPVARHLLTKRNRLQSGLTHATFIAQTGLPTGDKPAGTIHTARYAIEQGRLLAVAAPPASSAEDPELAGNRALTDAAGIDPALLHATDPALVASIASRRPVADVVIASPEDMTTLLDRVDSAYTV